MGNIMAKDQAKLMIRGQIKRNFIFPKEMLHHIIKQGSLMQQKHQLSRVALPVYRAAFISSSSAAGGSQSEIEKQLELKLKDAFKTETVTCRDISGGCGSMYNIHIESLMFSGVSKVQATRMVNKVLADDIKSWHGMTLTTSAPSKN